MVLQVILLLPYLPDYIAKKYHHFFNQKERKFLMFIVFGYLILPAVYVFSTWFSWFDYNLPKWISFPAAFLYGFGFWIFYRAYVELGPSWSPGYEIREGGHLLVTSGLYKWVRHPIYASFLALAVAQVFLLQNWIVGPAFLLLGFPFYRYRVSREEKSLSLHFGEKYESYRNQTNALIPAIDQIDFTLLVGKFKAFVRKRFKILIRKKAN